MTAFDDNGQLVFPEKVQELEECFEEFTDFVTINNELVKNHQAKAELNRQFSWELDANGGQN